MTEFDTEQIETRLRERAEEIASRRQGKLRTDADMRDAELADYDQHPADEGTETHEQELDETTDMMLAAEADQVELALQRLAEGKYGICIDCGKEIPRARLDAIPESVRCIEDQARYEATLKASWPPPNREITP